MVIIIIIMRLLLGDYCAGKNEWSLASSKKNQKLKTPIQWIVMIQPSACEACDG